MSTTILDEKGEGRFWIAIHDLRNGKNDNRKPAFNVCVYDTEKEGGNWNDYIAVTAADSEKEAREAMDKFYDVYYKEVKKG